MRRAMDLPPRFNCENSIPQTNHKKSVKSAYLRWNLKSAAVISTTKFEPQIVRIARISLKIRIHHSRHREWDWKKFYHLWNPWTLLLCFVFRDLLDVTELEKTQRFRQSRRKKRLNLRPSLNLRENFSMIVGTFDPGNRSFRAKPGG